FGMVTSPVSNGVVQLPVSGSKPVGPRGGTDVFVTKLNAAGTQAEYTTIIGGSSDESATAYTSPDADNHTHAYPVPVGAVAIDAAGRAVITGVTMSNNFPVTDLAYQTTYGDTGDGYLTVLNGTGDGLVYSTYI